MKMNLLEEHILQLETDLLKPEIRASMEKTRELLSDGFIEFCSSGYIWYYDKSEPVNEKIQQANWEIKDFSINQLGDDCILATYKLIKHSEINENKNTHSGVLYGNILMEDGKCFFIKAH